jgi:hypothetical protein
MAGIGQKFEYSTDESRRLWLFFAGCLPTNQNLRKNSFYTCSFFAGGFEIKATFILWLG